MNLQLSYELDKDLLVEGAKAVIARRYQSVRIYAVALLVSGMVLLSGLFPGWPMVGWIFALGGPLTWLGLEIQLRRLAAKQMKAFGGPIQASINDESIRQELAAIKSEIKWPAVTAVRRTGRLWLLMLSPVQAIHLPKSAFSAEAAAEFEAFLRLRGLLGA